MSNSIQFEKKDSSGFINVYPNLIRRTESLSKDYYVCIKLRETSCILRIDIYADDNKPMSQIVISISKYGLENEIFSVFGNQELIKYYDIYKIENRDFWLAFCTDERERYSDLTAKIQLLSGDFPTIETRTYDYLYDHGYSFLDITTITERSPFVLERDYTGYTEIKGVIRSRSGSSAPGTSSIAEGVSVASCGEFSHAEGLGKIRKYTIKKIITDNVSLRSIELFDSKGEEILNMSSYFNPGQSVIINDEFYKITATSYSSHANELAISNLDGSSIELDSFSEGNIVLTPSKGTFSLSGIAIGSCSHVEGFDCVTENDYAHAEGSGSKAVGESSHSEGHGEIQNSAHIADGFTITRNPGYDTEDEIGYSVNYLDQDNKYMFKVGQVLCDSSNGLVRRHITSIGDGFVRLDDTIGESNDDPAYIITGIAYGDHSHVEGNGCFAGNNSAHAEGTGSSAYGPYSHAEGLETEASESRAHAEGYGSKATNKSAHAEGHKTLASGERSHAEGYNTVSSAKQSHAEGYNTTANANNSHAEGSGTTASGNAAHSEGNSTTASGVNSHAEGETTTATGKNSHAEGLGTTASADRAHAEGFNTTASEIQAHAEGYNTKASKNQSHAEGYESEASGNASHSEGHNTLASGKDAHAEGVRESIVVKESFIDTIKAGSTEKKTYGSTTHASAGDLYAVGYRVWKILYPGETEWSDVYSRNITVTNVYGSEWFLLSESLGIGNSARCQVEFIVSETTEFPNVGAKGEASHIEGVGTDAQNKGEHAEGKYNVSISGVTQHTVGIGTSSKRKNAHLITTDGKHYIPGIGGYDGTEESLSGKTDLATFLNNFSATPLIEKTWSELKALRDGGNLVPGTQYRITDYVTTTVQEDTQSAGHIFDIIVIADSANTLNENARAIQHAGDTYFANSNLSAWELKYDLDNDTTKYAWADSVNGKGVIYRMIDEWNNECPYDFKNIQFKRKLTDGEYDPESGVDTWVYTFTWVNENDVVEDLSIVGNTLPNDEGQYSGIYNNVIKSVSAYDKTLPDSPTKFGIALNDIVFISPYSHEGGTFNGCYANTFGIGCMSNTFGNDCYSNTFGNDCYSNTFGNYCTGNTFGNGCYSNTFGNDCYSNTFGNDCHSNTFENGCYSNTFENGCYSNTFGDDCTGNTFGNDCYSNSFEYGCSSNTFGNDCRINYFWNDYYNNTFGKDCRHINIKKAYVQYIIVENGNSYIDITSTQTTSLSNVLRNFTIAQGVNNTSTRKTISHNTVNDVFKTTYQPANSQVVSI